VVLGERGLDKGMLEYKGRRDSDSTDLPIDGAIDLLRQRVKAANA
jgi:prolyl-tRNA synthetase